MFYTNMQHVHQSRTIKPRYARTQATPQAVRLDPNWDRSKDIFPGSVLSRSKFHADVDADGNYKPSMPNDGIGVVTLADGKNSPAGLCGNWIAPKFGIDEARWNGNNDIAMWVLNADSIFAIEAPAFDIEGITPALLEEIAGGKSVYLKPNENGLLTYDGNKQTAQTIAQLVGIEGTDVILVAGVQPVGEAEGGGGESE